MAKQPKLLNISDIKPDDKNFNKGTQFGAHLIEKSFEKFGPARSILLDKNNNVIAGNKSLESYTGSGGEQVLVIETMGDIMVAVKRTDIDLNTEKGRELALADNAAAKENIKFDIPVIELQMAPVIMKEWGIKPSEPSTTERKAAASSLKDSFHVKPVSVIDATTEAWKNRKAIWETVLEGSDENINPVLLEVLLNWFSNPGDAIDNPCNSSTHLTSQLGAINRKNFNAGEAGCIFTVLKPSAKNYHNEIKTIEAQISTSIKTLMPGSFAIICFNDVRAKDGRLYDISGDIHRIMAAAGTWPHSEMIVINDPENTRARIVQAMKTRMITTTHSRVMVFFNGTKEDIKNRFPAISTN